jgi:L-ascorbate 6-phosphate lactonase
VDRTPIDELRALPATTGSVGLAWLGQAGFVLRVDETIALLDPFLSPHGDRLYETSLPPSAAHGVDVVLCSHEHIDHFDAESAPAIAAASPGAVFVVPTPIVDMVTEAGIAADRVVGMQPRDDPIEIAGLAIGAVPAMHGVTMEDAYGFGEAISGGMVRFLGFVIEAGDVRLYHAGDTIRFEGMDALLREQRIDVGMLPINGRDAAREARGIVGNLSETEAAALAEDAGFGYVIPMHYDMIEGNLGDPTVLVEEVERHDRVVRAVVPERDRPFLVSGELRS